MDTEHILVVASTGNDGSVFRHLIARMALAVGIGDNFVAFFVVRFLREFWYM